MEKPVKQRIKKVLSSKRVSITALCKAIGVPQPTLNRQINTDAPMTLTNILLILDYFSDVSVTWLLTGEGSMLKNEIKGIASPNTMDTPYIYNMYEDYKKLQAEIIAEKERRIKELETKLAQLEKQQESLTTNSSSHAETAQKKRSSLRISGSSAQADVPTIK